MNWADLPNTVIKLSAVPEQTQYPHPDVRPVVRNIVQRFGPGRVIYGGGFGPGVTPENYRAKREATRALIDFLAPEEQAQILGGNATKLFGFAGRV